MTRKLPTLARAGRMRRRLALCVLAIMIVGAVAGGVTYAAFTSTTSSSGNSFTAAASFAASCPSPTASFLTGFESGAVSAVGGGLFEEVWTAGGTPIADPAVKRNGNYSLRVAKSNSGASYVLRPLGGTTAVERVAIRFATLPTADLDRVMGFGISTGNSLRVGYLAGSNKLEVHFANGPKVAASSTVTAGAWHVIDLKVATGANPRTASWRVDGVAQTGTSSAETASTLASVWWGSVNPTIDVFTVNYDDVLVSSTPSDYPLGDGKVLALAPNTSAGPSTFLNEDGTQVDAASYTGLDETPMDSIADHVYQSTISGTSYVELGFANATASCINGVSAVMAHHSASSAQATNAKTSVFDGSTESVVYAGNMVSTSLAYRSAIVPRASPWTTHAVNTLVARFGYTTAGSVVARWDALLVEYDVPQ